MSFVDKIIRPHLKALVPYSSARDEYTGNQGIFLDANENAIGSIGLGHWNRYPDPYQREIKMLLANSRKLDEEQVFIGNGSDEPIDLLIRAFCDPGTDEIVIFPPTYGMYKVSATVNNVSVREILLNDDLSIDTEALRKQISSKSKIVFVCSPNNPTGNLIKSEQVAEILELAPGLVVVDEAYIDFSTEPSWTSRLQEHENLVVLQTFSKAWGLASLRVGMAFASPGIIAVMTKIKPPYNVSGPVQEMIINALRYPDVKRSWVDRLLTERGKLRDALVDLPIVEKVFPSDGNFLLVRFQEAKTVFRLLLKNKVIVRDRSSQPLCENCLRITVGTDHENQRLLQLLTNFETNE
jgi:histidinol-phosphate aminotransferase